jgi:sulfofructose kinase
MKNPFPPVLPAGRPHDVVGLGGNAADYLITVPRFPSPDSKMKFLDFRFQGGGRTATPMFALARLGCRVRYLGCFADDAEGGAGIEALRAAGVDVSGVRIRSGGLSQRAFILVDKASGERTIIWGRSEGMPLAPEEIEEGLVASGRLFYTDAQDPQTAARAAPFAIRAGMPVLADIEDIRTGLDGFLPWVDFLIVSAGFPRLATGSDDLGESTRVLEERTGGALVVVTQGNAGCAARIEGRIERFPAYAVEVRDTTGAGDLFHAGFALACLRGMELREALDFANALAAMSCRTIGARAGVPESVEEIECFRRETPHRQA